MDLFEDRALVHWDETRHNLDPVRLMAWVGENAATARILPPAKLELRMPGQPVVTAAMQALKDMLLGLRERVRADAPGAGQD
jgi:transcription-repair coupling factor (superfamily II helicase)